MPTVCVDDVKAICDCCVLLRSTFEHFCILFEAGDLRRELLHSTASMFFGDLNRILIDHLTLQICKITDPEKRGKTVNLTIKFFLSNSDFSAAPNELEHLRRHSDAMHAFREKLLPARNKLIGHLDLDSVRAGAALGATERSEWTQFWLDLEGFLNILHRRYIEPDGNFYLNRVAHLSDADSVVKALKESTYFRAMLGDKGLSRPTYDAAQSSKYFNA